MLRTPEEKDNDTLIQLHTLEIECRQILKRWYFKVCLFALSYWSFRFASLCSFPILAYVGYIMYCFPSLFQSHHLNGVPLMFILLWATCTHVFNIIFMPLNKNIEKDMATWEALGFWHYNKPGLFLLAQFIPAILLAVGNIVNGNVFSYLVDGDGQPKYHNLYAQGEKLGINDMDCDTDEKTMVALRCQLRKAREQYYRHKRAGVALYTYEAAAEMCSNRVRGHVGGNSFG